MTDREKLIEVVLKVAKQHWALADGEDAGEIVDAVLAAQASDPVREAAGDAVAAYQGRVIDFDAMDAAITRLRAALALRESSVEGENA